MDNKFEILSNKKYLQGYLSFFALYIGLYENFIESTIKRVESFLCMDCSIDNMGNVKYEQNEIYRNSIKNRIVDDKGNKDILKATMLWFVDMGAINQVDYDAFLQLKILRNSYVHELANRLWDGINRDDIASLGRLLELCIKIDKWWINEIDIPSSVDVILDNDEKEQVSSLALLIFKKMMVTFYGENPV